MYKQRFLNTQPTSPRRPPLPPLHPSLRVLFFFVFCVFVVVVARKKNEGELDVICKKTQMDRISKNRIKNV